MNNITAEQFKADFDSLIASVLSVGEAYKITTTNGNAVLIEEAEYNALRDALTALFTQQ